MKETGILFTPDNIRAIREGRKNQTRRFCDAFGENLHYGKKLNEWALSSGPYQLTEEDFPVWHWRGKNPAVIGQWAQDIQTDVDDNCMIPVTNPYGQPGDRLYIKEGVIIDKAFDPPELAGYYMDGARATLPNQKRLTAMFMAKRYARTWLEITDVRVERVQDISEEDAKAEGASKFPVPTFADSTYKQGFERLWDSINRKTHPWASNPWVWCLTFIERKTGK